MCKRFCIMYFGCLLAEIVASKPLSGLKPTNLNEFHRRVVYFERGETSLRDKVRALIPIQEVVFRMRVYVCVQRPGTAACA